LTNVFFAAVAPNDRAAENPLVSGLTHILDRIGDRMSAEWRNRFIHHLIDCFTANIWQAAHRRTDEIPDLDTFPAMRRDTGAVPPTFDLIEFVKSTTLPAEFYYSRVYQRLITSAANVVCWTNDLMTLEKEFAHDDEQNFVSVLGRALKIPLAETRETRGLNHGCRTSSGSSVINAVELLISGWDCGVMHPWWAS
jgi:Terpene synthase family 2, C-terminal metal binding